ncbi:glycosyltransferase family 2 protein [Spongisporangium articulatum]|uniref:Glycosyltransferase family 2 protein n=1 Tax=Spongisporangium articulatum TaxID=3362603 RepID=A0ABW8ATW8_9ACTN
MTELADARAEPPSSAPGEAGPARWSDRWPPPPLVGVSSGRAVRINQEYARWRPHLSPFFVAFAILLVWYIGSYHVNRTPLGWAVTIVWCFPIVGVLVGLQGVAMLKWRWRRQQHSPPPLLVTQESLIVVVPSIARDDTYPALQRSLLSFVKHLPAHFMHLRVDVVVEEGCEAGGKIRRLARRHKQLRVLTVPASYATPAGTRFKSRANHYAHELRITEGEAREDIWVLHMDDDTGVGPDTAQALAEFVHRQRRAGADAKHLAQGILSYPRENAANYFTWLADAVRPADDFARFRALTGTGTPVAGVHGELLVIRASVEATIGWDFGPSSIVEDSQFALNFCYRYPGRSDWFNGRCYGASPATVRDFVRQRERWAWGLVGLAFNRSIPFRYRAFLGLSVFTWILGPLQHLGVVLLIAWATGSMNTSPVTQSAVLLWSINFGYIIWTYWEGLRLNALSSRERKRRWYEPILVIVLIPVFSLLEGAGGLRGFLKFLRRKENSFTVIAKPV